MRLFIILVFSGFFCCGQRTYKLEQCIDLALSKNPDITLQELNILSATNSLNQTLKSRFPSLSASVSNGLNGGRSIDPFSNSFVQRNVSYNSFGVSSNWNLFNGFSVKNQIEQNRINIEVEKTQQQAVKKELKMAVIEAYMNAVINDRLIILQLESEKDLLNQLNAVNERIKEGVLASYNKTEIDAQLANTKYELINAKNNFKRSKMILAQLMLLKGDFEIEIPEVSQPILSTSKSSISFHPALMTLEKRIQSAKTGVEIAAAERFPRLSLNMGLGTSYSSAAAEEYNYFNQLGFNFNQYLGLGLNIPIFSNGQINSRIETARISEKIARKQKEKQELILTQQTETRLLDLSSLAEQLNSAETNVQTQTLLYQGAKEKFNEGLVSNLELSTYRMALEKAKSQFIQTKYEMYYKGEALKVFYE